MGLLLGGVSRLEGGAPTSDVGELLCRLPLAVLEGQSQINEALEELSRKIKTPLKIGLRCSSLAQAAEAVGTLGFAALLPTLAQKRFATGRVEMREFPGAKIMERPLVLAWNPRQTAIRPRLEQAMKELASHLKLTDAPVLSRREVP